MTSPYPPPYRRGISPSVVRDICALVLLLVGVVGIVLSVFAMDPLAGWLVLSVLTVALGVALGYRRTTTTR